MDIAGLVQKCTTTGYICILDLSYSNGDVSWLCTSALDPTLLSLASVWHFGYVHDQATIRADKPNFPNFISKIKFVVVF